VRRKRASSGFFAAVAVILLYFILFPHPLGTELVAHPAWAINLPLAESLPPGGRSADRDGDGGLVAAFHLGDLFGFVDPSGRLLHAERALFRVALSNRGFVNYTRIGSDWVLRDPGGERLFSFAGRGYPLASADGNRVFVVKTDLTGVQELDGNGEVLWSRDFPSMLASVSVEGKHLLAGLIDGSLELVDATGAAVFTHVPAGSRIPVILAVAAAPDGSHLAAVSGIDRQWLIVLARKGASYAEVSRSVLPVEFRKELRLAFSPDSRYLALEGDGMAGLYDPASRRLSWIQLEGALAGVSFLGTGRAAALLAGAGSDWRLTIAAPPESVLCGQSFSGKAAFVGSLDGQILLAVDGRLLRVDVEAM
jgi:hypothetical protein